MTEGCGQIHTAAAIQLPLLVLTVTIELRSQETIKAQVVDYPKSAYAVSLPSRYAGTVATVLTRNQ